MLRSRVSTLFEDEELGSGQRISLIPILESQKQADLCEFEAYLVYRSLGQPWLHRETLSQKQKPNQKQKTKQTKKNKKKKNRKQKRKKGTIFKVKNIQTKTKTD